MKAFTALLSALIVSVGLWSGDAEAKRLGGGKSLGSQRDSTLLKRDATQPPANAPTQAAPTNPQAPGAVPSAPRRSWLGPVAGLAAGLGLAALASYLGFSEELASLLLMVLLALAAVVLLRLIFRRKASAATGMHLAGAGPGRVSMPFQANGGGAGSIAATPASGTPAARVFPAGFDAEAFVRQAKVNFIRLQAANDAANLDDIREFTTPEMFAELSLQLKDRGPVAQETDVVRLEAEVLDVSEEAGRYIASVRFHGLVREEAGASPSAFDEVWHLTKPREGSRGWVIAGIQQMP